MKLQRCGRLWEHGTIAFECAPAEGTAISNFTLGSSFTSYSAPR